MSVIVRFKNDEFSPCPISIRQDAAEQAAWQAVRGKAVRIGQVVPRSQIHSSLWCDTDTYWEVVDESHIETTADILGLSPVERVVVCRHLLEMGD